MSILLYIGGYLLCGYIVFLISMFLQNKKLIDFEVENQHELIMACVLFFPILLIIYPFFVAKKHFRYSNHISWEDIGKIISSNSKILWITLKKIIIHRKKDNMVHTYLFYFIDYFNV